MIPLQNQLALSIMVSHIKRTTKVTLLTKATAATLAAVATLTTAATVSGSTTLPTRTASLQETEVQEKENWTHVTASKRSDNQTFAEQPANRFIDEGPTECSDRHKYTRALHDYHNYHCAMKLVDLCIQEDQKDYIAHYWRGDLLYHQGKVDEALDSANECLRYKQDYAPAYSLRASCEYRKGNLKLAIKDARRAANYKPAESSCWQCIDSSEQAAPQIAKRNDASQQWRSLKAHNLNKLSIALLNCGHSSEAKTTINRAIKLAPDNPDLLHTRSLTMQALGIATDALKDIDRAIELRQEGIAEDYLTRADIYNDLAQYDNAIVSSRKALELKADYSKAYYNLALAQYFEENYQEAIDNCTRALNSPEPTTTALKVRGLCYQEIGEDNNAINDFESYTNSPKESDFYKVRSRITMFPSYHKIIADDLPSRMQLSYNFKSNPQNYDRLIALYNIMISQKTFNNETYYERGMLRLTADDYRGAAADFEQYLEANECSHALNASTWAIFCYQMLKQESSLNKLLEFIGHKYPKIKDDSEFLFLRKRISAEELMSEGVGSIDRTTKGTLIGLVLSNDGKLAEASDYLRRVKRLGYKRTAEYSLALKELNCIEQRK